MRRYPRLQRALDEKSRLKRVATLRRELDFYQKKYAGKLRERKIFIERRWRVIERKALAALSQVIGESWPSRTIRCNISLNSICPRFLDTWTFHLFFRSKADAAVETILHECCHFLYFQKWKKLFPEVPRRRYDSPHLEWHLSEIVTPVILNDPRLQKFFHHRAAFYQEHWGIRMFGIPAPKYFTRLYRTTLKNGGGFDDFLRRAYRAIVIKKKKFQL